MKSVPVVTVLFLINFCTSAKLPPTFKKCDRKRENFNDCLSIAVKDAIMQLRHSKPEIGLPVLEPLFIPSWAINLQGIKQSYRNYKMWGLTNITSMRVDMNFEAKILEIEAQFLNVKGEFEYEMHGRLLIMELNGKGPGFVNFVKPNATLTFKLGEYEKRRKKHYKVTGSKLVVAPQSVSANFDNIINGDKELSDNINKMFNDNWKGLFEEIGPTYEDACAQVFQGIFNRVLSKVPVDELFGGE